MIFRQVLQEDLGCASYLIGDDEATLAAVVDPRLDVAVYLELAERFGVRITAVIETHTHADHVSGHGRLVEATGASIHINPAAEPAYEYVPLPDGGEVALGEVVIRAVHLPGHRPEHTVLEVIDTARGPEPWGVLTGDSLLVGDVARPDLAIEGEEGAPLIYDGLSSLLGRLGPETELWPGHVRGSACGSADIDLKTSSTLGFELAHSPLLGMDKEEFVERILGDLGERPANLEAIVELNRGPLDAGAREPSVVGASEAAELLADGAVAVDVRRSPESDAAHVAGAVCIPVGKTGFATELVRAVGADSDIVFVGAGEEEGRRAAALANAVGAPAGSAILAGGMAAWEKEGLPTQAIERVPAADMPGRLDRNGLQLVDIRSDGAFKKRSVDGSVHAKLRDLREIPGDIDPSRPVAVACGIGYRSGIGASLLQRAGAEQVIHVVDGGVGDVLDAAPS